MTGTKKRSSYLQMISAELSSSTMEKEEGISEMDHSEYSVVPPRKNALFGRREQ